MSKKKVNRAGVLPWHVNPDGELRMLFMIPSNPKYGGSEYQIAKGKQEDGEDDETTAFREANEELGLFKPNCEDIAEIGTFLGRTIIYTTRVVDLNLFGKPHFETGSTKWLTSEEFEELGRDLHKPIVKACLRKIKKQIAAKEE